MSVTREPITTWTLGYTGREQQEFSIALDSKGDYTKLKALVNLILAYASPINCDTANRSFIVSAELLQELVHLQEQF